MTVGEMTVAGTAVHGRPSMDVPPRGDRHTDPHKGSPRQPVGLLTDAGLTPAVKVGPSPWGAS
ncbi:hypothetical protein SAMN06272775_5928 [Streptomyces sp. 2323.1]|nr:hypothetical protein SAMN06272775_5928 [Streptomyces sp. 2323.1]